MHRGEIMENSGIHKIIYFDKETIRNILQEKYEGSVAIKTNITTSKKTEWGIEGEVSSTIKISVPILQRLSFLFTGRLNKEYVYMNDNTTTISSTEISEFRKIKDQLTVFEGVQLTDIENSSTSFRLAGDYLQMFKGAINGLDARELKNVMDSYDGYDTYKKDDMTYVRFNNTAFVSNYKRNDLLITTMDLYCISVGRFDKKRFDFVNETSKLQGLFNTEGKKKTIADLYPPSEMVDPKELIESDGDVKSDVVLYDVLYANVSTETTEENEKV